MAGKAQRRDTSDGVLTGLSRNNERPHLPKHAVLMHLSIDPFASILTGRSSRRRHGRRVDLGRRVRGRVSSKPQARQALHAVHGQRRYVYYKPLLVLVLIPSTKGEVLTVDNSFVFLLNVCGRDFSQKTSEIRLRRRCRSCLIVESP